ncbi:thioesterase domain-containing protein [Streptomyces sp. NPDC057697]|uniref:thioesterase domain-containing protein n=1 Tax=Streptomyces sp. NPDC057697 TaxID=3346219 RepID=UPI00367F404D
MGTITRTSSTVTDFASAWATRRPARDGDVPAPLELASGSGIPVFITPYTAGNIAFMRDVVDNFRDGHPVYGFEAIGLRDRTEPPGSVPEIAKHYLCAIRRIQPHGPYLLSGLCGGSQIAYEIATRLVESGEQVGPLNLVNAARGELDTSPRLGLADLYDMRLASLAQRFKTTDLDTDLDHVMEQMCELHWLDEPVPASDFYWRQALWSASYDAFIRCSLGRLDIPVNVFITEESAHDPEVLWDDIAPRSTVRSMDEVTSAQITSHPAFVDAMRDAFEQVGA